MSGELRDEFLSEEDLDLAALSEQELVAYWNLWLAQAQITNEFDAALSSHGVFERDPAVADPFGSSGPGSLRDNVSFDRPASPAGRGRTTRGGQR